MMQAMPYKLQQDIGVVEVSQVGPKWKSLHNFQLQEQQEQHLQVLSTNYNNSTVSKSGNKNNSSRATSSIESEPTSPPSSTSTLPNIVAGVADLACIPELHHHRVRPGPDNVAWVGGGGGVGIGFEEWESLFPYGDGVSGQHPDDPGLGGPICETTVDFNLDSGHLGGVYGYTPQLVMSQQQAQSVASTSFVMSPVTLGNYCEPRVKRHNPGLIKDGNHIQVDRKQFIDSGHRMDLHQQPMGVKDQLFKAADLIQTGNFSLAQEILARLNHQLSVMEKLPIARAALYVKEVLQMLLQLSNPVSPTLPKMLTPYDVVHKMNAYKVFSEVSPITQFMNFTCTQAILEALDDAHAVHVVDFDIGCGAQWASFIQELPLRKKGAPSLRITAVVPPTTHAFELTLVRENLVQFANDIDIAFELQVVNLDSFDPSSCTIPNFTASEDECIAVCIPIWSSSTRPSLLPSILRFIKEYSPRIVVSLDNGFDRCDVPFPQHVIHSLESCTNLLESLDGLNVALDTVSKVERFFIQPRIENSLLGRLHTPNKMPHWKNLFALVGLVPLHFSNFTETQADYVVKRTLNRGFHVDKRRASLVLSWQRRELVAVSAWRC